MKNFAGWRIGILGCAWRMPTVRLHAENMTRNAVAQGQAILAVLDKFYANPNLPADVIELKQSVYAQGYLRSAARAYGAGELLAAKADLERAVQLDPNLLSNHGQPVLEHFAGWALQPLVGDPAGYLATVFSNLPDAAASLHHRRRQALALVWMSLFFRADRQKDHRQVQHCFARAILNDPGWLLNRGVIVILLRSLR
jgi:hypothetical protein